MVILLALLLGVSALSADGLTDAETRAGWRSLFNGRNLDGWMWSTATPAPVPCWKVAEGLLQTTPGQCEPTYLLTLESFEDFEMSFEWRSQPGGNSGVKYRFQGYWVNKELRQVPEGPGRIEPVALEYQIIDDQAHPDALTGPTHSAAAVYEYWAPKKEAPAKADVWHSSRIVTRGLHVEHWLDGKKVVDIQLDAPEVQDSFAKSRRRGSSPVLAKHERRSSPIALQFHDGEVCFRNLKIRRYSK
ncbi:MAG TPA: DUF1080 domain-containing protein [Bryobacteraceae bacterium]|nr:DUF1080 domain-containing protein [Bryobacteraceae bacterium]